MLAFAGDGGTHDIGIQSLSGAAERQSDFMYICYDNEGYMNTGNQRSGSTPIGTVTGTTPVLGKQQNQKYMTAIMEAHGLPYVATCSASYPLDLYEKVKKARTIEGTRFLHIHTPCPPGWATPRTSSNPPSRSETCRSPTCRSRPSCPLRSRRGLPPNPVRS